MHIADGIDVHQEADAAHHEQHDGAQRIDHQPHVHRERAGKNPRVQLGLDRVLRVGDDPENDDKGEQQGQPDRADANVMGLVTQDAAPQQAVEQHGRRGQNRDQPHEQFHKTDNSFHSVFSGRWPMVSNCFYQPRATGHQPLPLPLQHVDLVQIEGGFAAVHRDHQRQANGGLGGGDCDDEEGEYLTA